jgi:hypothetical protein
MPRTDLALALCLAGLTAVSRVPFRARLLPSWDAIQFALALHEYDVVKHQPHPPGYILYVALARLVVLATGDATIALTWLALGASAVAVFLVYHLAWRLYGRPTAVAAAVGLATSPLFWFYGEVGLSYAIEAMLATTVAVLAWPMREGRRAFAGWSALALGVAGGARQSVLFLLLPLWLASARMGLGGWRPVFPSLAVVGLVTAAWFVPMVWLAGGLGRYGAAAAELFDSTVRPTTIVGAPGAWRINASGLGEALVLAVGVLLPILVVGLAIALARLPRWDARAWFFAAWIVPSLAVYQLVHFGQYGYLLTILPAVYILLARGLVGASPAPARRWAAAVVIGVAGLVHAAFFTSAPPIEVPGLFAAAPGAQGWATSLRARYRFRLWPTTARGLREQEAVIVTYVEGVRRHFEARDTVLVTELGNPRSYPWFRHVGYYLPGFAVYHLRLGPFSPGYLASRVGGAMAALDGPEILLPPPTRHLVWVVDYWNPGLPRPPGLREEPLPYGRWLYTLDVERRVVEHGGYRFTPATAVVRLR